MEKQTYRRGKKKAWEKRHINGSIRKLFGERYCKSTLRRDRAMEIRRKKENEREVEIKIVVETNRKSKRSRGFREREIER